MKAGLEVHQQLSTGKLFCACPSELSETVTGEVRRKLRATGGENHTVDAAAAFQASRQFVYRYEATDTSCLVELDEEPPNPLNREAIQIALTMAFLLHARLVDEVQVMRKIVVDGSNTSGFQRTALIAVDGEITVAGKRISIASICLEEDSARKIGEGRAELLYRLDRLGIPLIEIATGPEISTGAEAREVAEEIGALLRATGRVRRGIGTIREDLNVSTQGGARVEIKGVQELRLIERYAAGEEARQRHLVDLAAELQRRHAQVGDEAPTELTHLVGPDVPGAVGEVVRRGGVVLGVRLSGFDGMLRSPAGSEERLGRELADHARTAGVKGLLHSDELPGHGLGPDVVARVGSELNIGAQDAFLLVAAADPRLGGAALDRARARARTAIVGSPEETRDPLPDGRTRYSRPLPGRDRMYPETDVPPVPLDAQWLDRVRAELPATPEATRERVAREYGLGPEVVRQLQRSGDLERFETWVANGHPAGSVARLLTQDLPAVVSAVDDDPPRLIPDGTLNELLSALDRNEFAKEGVPAVLAALLQGSGTIAEAVRAAGFQSMTRDELVALAQRVVDANRRMLDEKGRAAFSPLMGDLMREVRGRRDGKEVAQVLREAIEHRPPTSPPA